ncbi:hypothetical protein SBOR_7482 [Sclerotinia borealis F-4128]|uniref:Uncharacterized protein n=1 Tax=Sclerotinia borealis (strain F-4128) TaxID=1432307 RepID=W9CC34_SCLBF|nr:hypothetical protein SBOR_7482 [Sclerotinia borealis F-4128]
MDMDIDMEESQVGRDDIDPNLDPALFTNSQSSSTSSRTIAGVYGTTHTVPDMETSPITSIGTNSSGSDGQIEPSKGDKNESLGASECTKTACNNPAAPNKRRPGQFTKVCIAHTRGYTSAGTTFSSSTIAGGKRRTKMSAKVAQAEEDKAQKAQAQKQDMERKKGKQVEREHDDNLQLLYSSGNPSLSSSLLLYLPAESTSNPTANGPRKSISSSSPPSTQTTPSISQTLQVLHRKRLELLEYRIEGTLVPLGMPISPFLQQAYLNPLDTDYARQFDAPKFDIPISKQVNFSESHLSNLLPRQQWELTFSTLISLKANIAKKAELMRKWVGFAKENRHIWIAAGGDAKRIDHNIFEFDSEVKRLGMTKNELRRDANMRQLRYWLSDTRGLLVVEEIMPHIECEIGTKGRIGQDGLRSMLEAFNHTMNTSWEACELLNYIKIFRWETGNMRDEWLPIDTYSLHKFTHETILGKRATQKHREDSLPLMPPFRLIRDPTFFPTPIRLEYSPAGFIHIVGQYESYEPWPEPPNFRGEEFLDIIRFYESGGTWNNRVQHVGPIEKKTKQKRARGSKSVGEEREGPFKTAETVRMREEQAKPIPSAAVSQFGYDNGILFPFEFGGGVLSQFDVDSSNSGGGIDNDSDDEGGGESGGGGGTVNADFSGGSTLVDVSALSELPNLKYCELRKVAISNAYSGQISLCEYMPEIKPPVVQYRPPFVDQDFRVCQGTLKSFIPYSNPPRCRGLKTPKKERKKTKKVASSLKMPGTNPNARCPVSWEVKVWKHVPRDHFGSRKRRGGGSIKKVSKKTSKGLVDRGLGFIG